MSLGLSLFINVSTIPTAQLRVVSNQDYQVSQPCLGLCGTKSGLSKTNVIASQSQRKTTISIATKKKTEFFYEIHPIQWIWSLIYQINQRTDVFSNKRYETKPGTSKGAGGVIIPPPFLRVSGSLIASWFTGQSLVRCSRPGAPTAMHLQTSSSREDKISSWWFQPPLFQKC